MSFEDKGVIISYQIVLSIKFVHSTSKQHSEGETDLIIFILCVCTQAIHAMVCVCVEVRGLTCGSQFSSFLHVVPRIQTQVIGLGSKPLQPTEPLCCL